MPSGLAFHRAAHPGTALPRQLAGANKPAIGSGRWSDAQQALCAWDKQEPAGSRSDDVPWGKWRMAPPLHFKAGCGGKIDIHRLTCLVP